MNTIGERIKAVRNARKYTQLAFAEQLGLKRNTVGGYEIGTVVPSDRTIQDICQKFHINEHWLRTGEGKMENPVDPDQELADFFAEVYQAPLDDPCRRVIAVLQRINRNCPELFAEIVKAATEAVTEQTKKED